MTSDHRRGAEQLRLLVLAATLDTLAVVGVLPERPVVHLTPATTTSPVGRS